MPSERSSLPLASGDRIETIRDGPAHIPFAALRGIAPSGEPVDVAVDETGNLVITLGAGSIVLDAEQINLNTDQLEGLLGEVRDRLPADGGSSEATLAEVRDLLDTVESKLQSLIDGPLVVVSSFDRGAWGEDEGDVADTVTVPAGALLHNVEVIPTVGGIVTLSVFGSAVFSQAAGYGISRDYRGKRAAGAGAAGEVVIGGAVDTYHVDWTV